MKQTAVELLAESLRFTNKEVYAELYEAILQAKEIEKQQIVDAYIDGLGEQPVPFFSNFQAEQYYNETFKDK